MKTVNNLSLSLVGLTVKTYMAISVLWSKADAAYHALKDDAKNLPASTSVFTTSAR
ncbi:MAG TPA: hypothetical protein VFM90_02005 [Cyclobacteriaceae bacterium]|nr:hypothetical protein [Cyclobacteriaceae bacterium]